MSADITQLEQRVTMVEAALIQIQRKLGLVAVPANWVDQISGSLADVPEEDYQQFLEYCRTVRSGESISDAGQARP
jgi:hypothetical protein